MCSMHCIHEVHRAPSPEQVQDMRSCQGWLQELVAPVSTHPNLKPMPRAVGWASVALRLQNKHTTAVSNMYCVDETLSKPWCCINQAF